MLKLALPSCRWLMTFRKFKRKFEVQKVCTVISEMYKRCTNGFSICWLILKYKKYY